MQNEFAALSAEYWDGFANGLEAALATVDGDDAAVRTMSAAHAGGKVYFATFTGSAKFGQMRNNPKVALCHGATRLQGVARHLGDGGAPESELAMQALRSAFPEDTDKFGALPGLAVFEIAPTNGEFASKKNGALYALDFQARTARKIDMPG